MFCRYQILYKYGGAYQDFEATWTQRVPDWLLSYPAVANSDWVQNGMWPDNLNMGVLLARPRAPWLRHVLAAQRYFVDNDFIFNACLMSYRTYERHPDQMLLYRHLQVRTGWTGKSVHARQDTPTPVAGMFPPLEAGCLFWRMGAIFGEREKKKSRNPSFERRTCSTCMGSVCRLMTHAQCPIVYL